MSDEFFGVTPPQMPRPSLVRKLGLGAALIAVPIGAALVFMKLNQTAERHKDAEEKGADYNPELYAKIDPAMIHYFQERVVAHDVRDAQAIAIDASGRLLVAGDHCLRFFSKTGQNPADIKLPGTPTAMAAASDGHIFLAFKDQVEIYNTGGERLNAWKPVSGAVITGLAVRGSDVFVADSANRIVLHCDLDGKVINKIGNGLVVPSPYLSVAALPDGDVLISNPGRLRMEIYSTDGVFHASIAEAGTGLAKFEGCCNPSNFAILADGRIVTAEKGVAQVKIFTADGKLDGVVGGSDIFGQSTQGLQLATDSDNRVWVMQPGSTSVRVFAPKPKEAGVL